MLSNALLTIEQGFVTMWRSSTEQWYGVMLSATIEQCFIKYAFTLRFLYRWTGRKHPYIFKHLHNYDRFWASAIKLSHLTASNEIWRVDNSYTTGPSVAMPSYFLMKFRLSQPVRQAIQMFHSKTSAVNSPCTGTESCIATCLRVNPCPSNTLRILLMAGTNFSVFSEKRFFPLRIIPNTCN